MSIDPITSMPKDVLSEAINLLGRPKPAPEKPAVNETLLETASKRIDESQQKRLYDEAVDLQESGDKINKEKARAFKAGQKNAETGGKRSSFKSPNIAAKYAKAEAGLKALKATRASRTAVAARNAGEDYSPGEDTLVNSQNKIKMHKIHHEYNKSKLKSAGDWVDAHHNALLDSGYQEHGESKHSKTYIKHDPETNNIHVAKIHLGGSDKNETPTIHISGTNGVTSQSHHAHLFYGKTDHVKNAKDLVAGYHRSAGDHWNRMNEETDLQELSKKTLGSYIKHAADDAGNRTFVAGMLQNAARDKDTHSDLAKGAEKQLKKADKRYDGISRAADKLTKEEVDLQERNDDLDDLQYRKVDASKKKQKRFADKKKDFDKASKKEYQYEQTETENDFVGVVVEHEEFGEGYVLDIQEDVAEVVFGEDVKKVSVEDLYVFEQEIQE